MTQYIKKLPAVFQTVTEKKFFDATFDQVFSKKDSDLLAGYIGRRNPGSYNPITDFYLPEPSKDRTWWQLEATAFARTEDTTKSNVFFYDDLLNKINYYGGNTLNQDRLFESDYYSFGPPIDFDMFTNYQNYYWVETGLPTITIFGVQSTDIVGQEAYTTPPSATPPNLTLTSGMNILLADDTHGYAVPRIVENMGNCIGIRLAPPPTAPSVSAQFEFLPWDDSITLSTGRMIKNSMWDSTTYEVQSLVSNGDYITIERGALDDNPWSMSNKWYHIDVINEVTDITGAPFPVSSTRALRPIIQFIADLQLMPDQEKLAENQPPLFQLYDHNGIELNDPITYPDNNFVGSKIFSYKVNTAAGATVDPVLKFPILYTSLGQASDIIFENNLITERSTYKPTNSTSRTNIDGYYYYRYSTDFMTIDNPVLYNSWNLYTPTPCDVSSSGAAPSKQRVIDKFTVGYGSSYQFKLSVTPVNGTDVIVSVNGLEVKDTQYSIVIINNDTYIDLNAFLTSLLSSTQSQPPVVEVQTYTFDNLDPAARGYFEIPQQLEANPSQLEVTLITGSELTQQFQSIIANQAGLIGSAYGSGNNYRDTEKNRSLGTYILQNIAPTLKSMLVSSTSDLDFVPSIRFSQDEYSKFKNKYLATALQLINREFNPVSYHNNTILVSGWVNEILRTVNVSKEFSNAFAYSYMVASGDPYSLETVTIPGNSLFTLSNYIDLSNPRNVLYIYDETNTTNEHILVDGVDYNIITGPTSISVQLNIGSGSKRVSFALYNDPLPTYIPSTPSKLGLYSVYIPRIEMDNTFLIPTNVIIGHDGSKTIAYGDYRDQLLLELEIRIFNGIQSKFRNEYTIPLRIETVKPGHYRQTRYSREEYLDITQSYINKWSAKNKANYRANDWATSSLLADPGNIWKLYNYRSAVAVDGTPLNLPGNWKGIFQYYYDTCTPDTTPWAMLGFSSQPEWWVTEYGPGVTNLAGQTVWPSTNTAMWSDIENGFIRQGATAIYDPATSNVLSQPTWTRIGLSFNLPVDAAGELVPVPTLFNIAMSGNIYEPFDGFDAEWQYGDGAPVEQAWMSTSSYAFSVQEFLYLTRPGPFGELMWDTMGTEISPGLITVPSSITPVQSNTNWQYVQNNVYSNNSSYFAWMRPKNIDQIVHAETIDNVVQLRFGYQTWISDRILFLGKDITSTFGQKVRTLDVNLANKLAGFTNKDTTNIYIEAITPGAVSNSLIIPSTNFDVRLHTSPVINTYSYSGVIIRALVDGTFVVYGYDLLKSQFITLDRLDTKLIDVSVGGTPADFTYFTPGTLYQLGDIVRYNGVYYSSKEVQTPQKFDSANWNKLNSLPVSGGISVTYKPDSSTNTTVVPYGTIFKTPQAVFDFLIGWGAYLETQGWKFNNVNQDTNQLNDWLYSAKQYLFWLNTNWAPDSSIQLSPLANSATLEVPKGYPNDIETISNGVYSILDKFGIAVPKSETIINRELKTITVELTNLSAGGIYFLQVNTSETEHILIFDNVTSFNDTIYAPLLRIRQQRLKFNGFRSNNWYGKMEAPGYLVIDNQLVPNFDTIVDSMRYYYDPNVTIDNPSLEDLGRHLIGYESKSYLDNMQVSNDVQYLFYQGAIREKGTAQSFNKLFRSSKIQSNDIIKVYEEWALKLGDFGNTVEQVTTEFILKPEQNTGEVIIARLNFVPSTFGFVKQVNIRNAEHIYSSVPAMIIGLPDATPDEPWSVYTPGAYYPAGSLVRYDDAQGNPVYYSSNVNQSTVDFNPTLWTVVLETRKAKAYCVLNSLGKISRVDITDRGYGYKVAPSVTVDFIGSEDLFYSVWQGESVPDRTLDNVIDIDIDNTDLWVVRPEDPTYSLEFPLTNNIEYPIPNAGYVNRNDVTMASFDVSQTALNWGSTSFNPVENNSVWIAKTFNEDWNVYKLIDISAPSQFTVIEDTAGNLILRTGIGYVITPQGSLTGNRTDFGNMIILQVIEAQATAVLDSGSLVDITVDKTGANYTNIPVVTITGDGINATAVATIVNGSVTGFVITNGGTGYTYATVSIEPPVTVSGNTNYAVAFTYESTDASYNYYNLVTLTGNPIQSSDIGEYSNFTKLMLFKTLRFPILPISVPTYIANGDKIWVDNVDSVWTVYSYNGTIFVPFRRQESLINTALFESATAFSNTGSELVQLPVYDPFKDILPGPAKQNISFMLMQDPARYNVTGNTRLFSENILFGESQVGKLWWDLSSTRYMYYEQPKALDGSETDTDNLAYRRDKWGQIFPGSTIQIYEWVKSPVPPSLYSGTGIPKDVTSYVQITTSNKFTSLTETNYYFWVAGTTTKPNIENRTMAALDVSRLLQSPKSQGFSFFAPIQQTNVDNSYMFYNVQEILAYKGNNIQLQYRLAERNDQTHAQWTFFREGDSNSLVSDQYWDKMVDSLCGYTKVLPISSDSSSRLIVTNPYPLNPALSDTSGTTGEILPVPNPSLSQSEKYGIQYRPCQSMFVQLQAARKVFVQAANSLLQYIPIRDTNADWDINVETNNYWTYTNWYDIGYENVTPNVVYSTLADALLALSLGTLQLKDIVQVTNGTADGRFELYVVKQLNVNVDIYSLEKIGIQASAVKLLNTVYTDINVYGLSLELRELLYAFRTTVMINNDIVNQNELYFAMLNYVMSEQKNPNWLFKSSYIYIKEDSIPLTQSQLYSPDTITNIIDYLDDAKPYHTQVRDYSNSYTTADNAFGTATGTLNKNIIIQFGPDYAGAEYEIPFNIVDPMVGWDSSERPWDTTPWDISGIENILNQYISRNPVAPDYDPGSAPWPSTYELTITSSSYDPSKKGYSELFPYTFTFDGLNLNNPQTFITPTDIVGVQTGDTVLIYGQDYYVEYNNDTTYTIYFFNSPGTSFTALVWFNGGDLLTLYKDRYRDEVADGTASDDTIINVDTKASLAEVEGQWDFYDPVLSALIIADGGTPPTYDGLDITGTAQLGWDQPSTPGSTLDVSISFKQNANGSENSFYRNAEYYSGTLMVDLPPATPDNTYVIVVSVNPLTHPISTDILPDPTNLVPGVIWINGERIEYRSKTASVAPNTWELRSVRRGTNGTSAVEHLALIPSLADPLTLVPNPVWIEADNIMPAGSYEDVWNAASLPAIPDPATEVEPGKYTSILNPAASGLWGANTPEAVFLREHIGRSIP